jgi:acyl-CoA thioesterase
MDAEALARACAEAMWAEDRASQGLGMRLESVGPGHAALSMTVTEAMVNGHASATAGSFSP